jgi:hypothetical protein
MRPAIFVGQIFVSLFSYVVVRTPIPLASRSTTAIRRRGCGAIVGLSLQEKQNEARTSR